MIMTRKERKSNESRLSNNIKRTATTVIITAAVVGSIGITNSVRAEEPEVRIVSSGTVDTNNLEKAYVAENSEGAINTNSLSSDVNDTNNNEDVRINSLEFNSNDANNNGGVKIERNDGKVTDLEPINPPNNDLGTDKPEFNKEELINKAKSDIDKLEHLTKEQKEAAKQLVEQNGVGKNSEEVIRKNVEGAVKIANEINEKEKKKKESTNDKNNNIDNNSSMSENNDNFKNDNFRKKRLELKDKLKNASHRDAVYRLLKEKLEGIDKLTKDNIEKLVNKKNIYSLSFYDYDKIMRELIDGLTDDGGNYIWEGVKTDPKVEEPSNNTPKPPVNPEKPKNEDRSVPKAEPRIEKPKQVEPKDDKPKEEPKPDKKENNPKVVVPEVEKKIEKKPEAKMPEANKPKVEKKPEVKMSKDNKPKVKEKKIEKPKVMAPKDNKDSLKPRVIDPKSDSKEKTENKKPENNSPEMKKPEMKKPEMKSPQKDDMNKKGDTNKNKMNEAPKKENNKNRMSDKMNETPKNIKKKMLPQMGIQHSIATSLMGLSSLVGAALILFKKNDK